MKCLGVSRLHPIKGGVASKYFLTLVKRGDARVLEQPLPTLQTQTADLAQIFELSSQKAKLAQIVELTLHY